MNRTFFVGATASLLLTCATRSRADGVSALDLQWDAPPECPRAEQVIREVDGLLGGASHRVASRISARAEVSPIANGWRVVLATKRDGVTGKRTLEARSCDALAHATAIVLAFTIGPTHTLSDEGNPPQANTSHGGAGERTAATTDDGTASAMEAPVDPRAKSPTAASAAKDRTGEHARDATRPPSFLVGAGVAGEAGLLPHVAVAPEVSLAWLPAHFRIELRFAYFPPVTTFVDANRGGEIELFAGAVRGCRPWVLGAFEVGPCFAFEAGVMAGKGIGIRIPGSGLAPSVTVAGGAMGAIRLGSGPAWLVVALGAEVPLTRYEFRVDAVGLVHQPLPVAARASFGGEVRF